MRTNEETGNYGRAPRTLARIKKDARIEDAFVDGDGFWLYIKTGFADMHEDRLDQLHTIREDTATALAKHLRYIEPCTCDGCHIADEQRGAK